MRDLVLARDRTCRGPGCRSPADRCDLDHTVPWPTGPTSPANLRALCRSHHRLKTHTDTTHSAHDHGGGHTWTLPSGRTYTREPEPVLDRPPRPDDDIPPF
jgi:hypothetical protein